MKKPVVTPNAKDLLSKLTTGKKPVKSAEAARKERPEMDLPAEVQDAVRRFAGVHALAEVVEKSLDQEKEFVDQGCFEEWLQRLWKGRTRPANPAVKLEEGGKVDVSLIFQVQERYSPNLPEAKGEQSIQEATIAVLAESFHSLGMKEDEAVGAATNLVTNELDFTPKTFIDFNKLVNGHFEGTGKNRTFVEASATEQAIATKVLQLLQCRTKEELADAEPLTDVEADQVVETKYSVVVKPGFLQRVCGYVNNLEQLRAVFMIIKPVKYPSHVKFAASDTPEERNRRLVAMAMEIMGVSV
jgi:hypothetical protein